MSRLNKALLSFAVLAGLTVGSLGLAAPASAYVSGCTTGFSSVGAWAQCSFSSSGYYKVRVLCQNPFTKSSYFAYGPKKKVGSQVPSTVECNTWPEVFYGDAHAQEG